MALSEVAVNPNALNQFLESVRQKELPEKRLKIPDPDAKQGSVSGGQGFDHSPAQFTDNGLIGLRGITQKVLPIQFNLEKQTLARNFFL